MTDDVFPDLVTGRPSWLVTLADLALLLVGFFVLVHATQGMDRGALAKGLRDGFGTTDAASPIPVAAEGMAGFAPGSAALPGSADGLIAWARDAVHDPQVTLTVTGATDGSATDVDPMTGSAAILAADRARGVAALLAHVVPSNRLTIATNPRPARRAVMVTQAFSGETR